MSFNFHNYVHIMLPEGQVKTITRKSDGVVIWQRSGINQVLLSTESDGVTIYNGGLGYKNNTRVRSGGEETGSPSSACTGFIPVKAGDVIRISGMEFSNGYANGSAINVSDSARTNLGQFTIDGARYGLFTQAAYVPYANTSVLEEKTGVWKWVVPPAASGIAHIRINANAYGASASSNYTVNGSLLIVTVNEEITR